MGTSLVKGSDQDFSTVALVRKILFSLNSLDDLGNAHDKTLVFHNSVG